MLAARSAAETSSGTIFMESSNSPMIFVSRALLAPESISNRVITVVNKLPLASSRATRSAAGSRPARKIDQDVGVRESHRQEVRIRVVSVSRGSACSGDRLPRSFSAFRRSASARSSASKYCSIAWDTMRENPFSFLRAANSRSLARCSSAISTVVLIASSV